MTFLNKWIASVLIYMFIIYVVITNMVQEEILVLFTPLMLVSALGITTSLTVNLALHYRGISRRFSMSYLFLSIGFAAYTIAEIAWAVMDLQGLEPYPSIADPFYILYFTFSSLFCIQMFWCRNSLISKSVKTIAVLASLTCFGVYLLLSYQNFGSEYYVLDTMFMILSSILIGTATLASLSALKAPQLRKVWVLIGIALFFNSIADVLYYSATGDYLYSDMSNIIWFGTTLLLFYALYLHRFLYLSDGWKRQ